MKEFKPFSASTSGMSFASPVSTASTTPVAASEVDDLAQSVELRFQSISLEQVSYFFFSSFENRLRSFFFFLKLIFGFLLG